MIDADTEAFRHKELSFEEALRRLEGTVQELRSDGLILSQAVTLYEEGVRLAAYCEKILAAAELRVTTIDAMGDNDSAAE